MLFIQKHPCAPLRKYIASFWYYESNQVSPNSEGDRIIPDGCIEIILHLGDPVIRQDEKRQYVNPLCNVIGQLTKPYKILPTGIEKIVGIRLYPHTAQSIFNMPLSLLKNQVVELQQVGLAGVDQLHEQLALSSTKTLFSHLDTFFLGIIQNTTTPKTSQLGLLAKTMICGRGNIPIHKIAKRHKRSNRYMELLFQDSLGLSPKEFNNIIRIQAALEELKTNGSLTSLAYQLGFADQAHFTRTFKRFTGLTPKGYRKETSPISDQFNTINSISHLFNF